jgi:hypothetical protein
MNLAKDGIYYLYRVYHDTETPEQRLLGVWSILHGKIFIMEDHDDFLKDIIPNRKYIDNRVVRNLSTFAQSAYYHLMYENLQTAQNTIH